MPNAGPCHIMLICWLLVLTGAIIDRNYRLALLGYSSQPIIKKKKLRLSLVADIVNRRLHVKPECVGL